MKEKKTFSRAVIQSAVMGALLFLILPTLDQIPGKELARRITMGLGVGTFVGAILWPIGQRFRKKETDAITQIQREKEGSSNQQVDHIS
jgi:hypothetical protein